MVIFILLLSVALLTQGRNIPEVEHALSNLPRDAAPDVEFTYMPIKTGYVAFGDSYAAGIGTGTTEGDGCRRGEFSYPKQLAKLAGDDIDFQNLPCSGAIIGDVLEGGSKSQIDAWTNPEKADMATLSIGGNDIGFFPILDGCILRIFQIASPNCDTKIKEAYDTINGRELYTDVQSALNQILTKSGRDDFKIILTGYPWFFNEKTDYCEYTTFNYWSPGHTIVHGWGNWAYLYKEHRAKLNKLVKDLNTMLKSAVDGINKSHSSQKVWFIDPNDAYEGHRFCEEGVNEPDDNRDDTWLFLSAWKDNSLPGSASSLDSILQEATETAKFVNGGANSRHLPDATACQESHDWYDQILCGMSQAGMVRDDPSQGLQLTSDNVTVGEVPWIYPTRSAKTFHPRTLGHLAYVDLIKEVW